MSEKDLRQVRAARNQSLFREVNSRLVELDRALVIEGDRRIFICECARMDCMERIEVSPDDYRRVRANPRRFLVAPSDDHVFPDVEAVVEATEAYFVVEKLAVGAEVAMRLAREAQWTI